jgi:serine protease Do
MNKQRLLSLALRLALTVSLSLQVYAKPKTDVENQTKTVIKKCIPAFVFIAHSSSSGSGVLISPDGYVITNAHVVRKAIKLTVRLGNGDSYEGKVVGRDSTGDLALIKLADAKGLPYVKLADSDKIKVGDLCIAIGNPIALGAVDQNPTVSMGAVSGLHQYRGGGRYNDAIVTDAPINPGNSGGPLLDLDGKLIGVNGLVESRIGLRSNTGLGYAIPSNQVKAWLPELKDPDRLDVYRCRLIGILFEKDFDKLSEDGALIKTVEPGSEAEAFGFKDGDVIFECQGYPVWNATRFAGILGIYPAGTLITINLMREGETVTIKITPEERRPAKFGFTIGKPSQSDRFLRITELNPKSASAKAGLKLGDEIIGLGKQKMGGLAVVQHAFMVQRWMPMVISGMKITFKVRRRADDGIIEKEIVFTVE